MRYAHARSLLEFAKVNLEIAHSQNPSAAMDVTVRTVTRSKGYKRLRDFYLKLSPRKQQIYVDDCDRQVAAIRAIMREAERTGEKITIGEIVISTFDDKGAPLAAPPKMGEGLDDDTQPKETEQ